MLFKIFKRRISDLNVLFNGHYVDVKCYYVMRFNEIPNIAYMGELDTAGAFTHAKERLGELVVSIYQHSYWDHNEQQLLANHSILILKEQRFIEFTESYCQVFYLPQHYEWTAGLLNELAAYRVIKENRIIGFTTNSQMN